MWISGRFPGGIMALLQQKAFHKDFNRAKGQYTRMGVRTYSRRVPAMLTDRDPQFSSGDLFAHPIAHRVDLSCSMAGLEPPPAPVHMKFYTSRDRWTLFAFTTAGKPAAVGEWLRQYRPDTMNIAPGLAPKYLRADFGDLPDPWDRLVCGANVPYLELTPMDTLSIFIEDMQENVQRFVGSLRNRFPDDGELNVRERWRDDGWKGVGLTSRQHEVLSTAVAWGYYEVPHKLNLRTLSEKLGISVGAISELLRRAEARVIKAYIDSSSELTAEAANEASRMLEGGDDDQRRQRMLSSST